MFKLKFPLSPKPNRIPIMSGYSVDIAGTCGGGKHGSVTQPPDVHDVTYFTDPKVPVSGDLMG